jgi:murein DD-endopeptidase MepM/ murein hydrolase activator NlpD
LVATASSVVLVLGAGTVHAQLGQQWPPIGERPTTTTTAKPGTPAAPQPTTTTTERRGLFTPPTPPTTAPTTTTTEPPPPASGDGTAAPKDAGAFPPELQAMVDSVRRTPANNTKKLVAALAPLATYGLDPTQQAVVGFGRFPVAGVASWSDDWWFPRFGPGWRLHQGVDIFAPYGTPVRAPVDGTVRVTNSGLGGLAVYVRQPNRTHWYMCHLSGLGPGIAEGVTVQTGQVVGYVGASGNARGGPSHMHLEIHPNGGPAVPPKPVIDAFVTDATAMVPQLLDAYAKADAQQAPVTVPEAAPAPTIPTLSPRDALLWATAASPAGGTLKLVEADALAAANRIDWSAVVAARAERAQAQQAARTLLLPLVPEALAEAAGWM